jgi:oligoendopeptidase F
MTKLPSATWDLTSYFPAFDDATYREFTAKLKEELVGGLLRVGGLAPLTVDNAAEWAAVFAQWEGWAVRLGHLSSYLGCLSAADAAHEGYQAALAATSAQAAELSKLITALEHGFAAADEAGWAALTALPELADARHPLTQWRKAGAKKMSAVEETLAADLGLDGMHAWGRLYDTVSGKMTWCMTWPDGREEMLSMSRRRALMADPDAAVRRAAIAGGNRVWKEAEDTMAAALNAIAGARHTLYRRRGQGHFLDQPMHDAAVGAETVAVMFETIAANAEIPRRILRAGARLQGTARLAWCDLEAPRFATAPRVIWAEGVAMCGDAFDATYPALGRYFRDTLDKRWVEAEPRANKRSGAFCTGSPLTGEERVYMTFNDTMGDVNTLAHEYGHAWHSHLLRDLRPCARDYPMTLAETASTFAENLLMHGLLADARLTPERRAFLIDQSTNHAPSYLLNIPMRFNFERQFYEERRAGVVSVSRIKELMVEAQRSAYGDTLDAGDDGVDPWFWASKLHFYISELSFYNFPYTFGFLLSQALYAEFVREETDFLPRYEAFLRLTGSATCEEAVRQALGRDLRDAAFWADGIRALEPKVRELEGLKA